MSLTRVRPHPVAPRAGALRCCPGCRRPLADGPILFYCCDCRRYVRAADVPAEVTVGAPSATAGRAA